LKEKPGPPILAAVASVGILYMDFVTSGVRNAWFSDYPGNLRVLCSLVFIISLWSSSTLFLFYGMRNETYPNPFGGPAAYAKPHTLLCVLIIICITAVMWVLNGGPKPLKELQYFLAFGKTAGWIGFMLQIIYYILEMLLALMIVYYSQATGELLTGKKNIPWGSMVLSLTWGLPHIFTKNVSVGMFSLIFGVALGGLYLLSGRNGKVALLYMCIAFIL